MNEVRSLNLLFGGDVAPIGTFSSIIEARSGEIWGDARELIVNSDFKMFNLEAPICDEGQAITKIGPAIRSLPSSLEALTSIGLDAVCLANNHIFDFGSEGLSQTLSALKNRGILHVGAGLDRPSAEAPLRLDFEDRKVSIFAFAEQEFNTSLDQQAGSALLDPLLIAPKILSEREKTDVLVVCFHGGNEYFSYPRPSLRNLCHFIIDLGADAVVGHHPHVPGPYEIYKGKPIVYSLGNLVFDTESSPPMWEEGYFASLHLSFDANSLSTIKIELHPYTQSAEQGGVTLMQGAKKEDFLSRISELRENLEERPEVWLKEWEKFVAKKQLQTIIDLSSPVRFRGFWRLMKIPFLHHILFPKSRCLHRLNMLRCESHRELVIGTLLKLSDQEE